MEGAEHSEVNGVLLKSPIQSLTKFITVKIVFYAVDCNEKKFVKNLMSLWEVNKSFNEAVKICLEIFRKKDFFRNHIKSSMTSEI